MDDVRFRGDKNITVRRVRSVVGCTVHYSKSQKIFSCLGLLALELWQALSKGKTKLITNALRQQLIESVEVVLLQP
jgi:hypothetical protein